jgi:serine/threonine protein kinase
MFVMFTNVCVIISGATGLVYKAVNTTNQMEVCIKHIVKSSMEHEEQLSRVGGEGTRMKKLIHKGITRLYDCIETKDSIYLIQEL